MKQIFLTGATGVIGSALVPLFLQEHDTRVQLLIRAKSDQELMERVQYLLHFWEIDPRDEALTSRIVPSRGDISQPMFGLAPKVYETLTKETTHIIHAAANVKLDLPLEEARRNAVTSAQLILNLAAACQDHGQLCKVDVLSTVGVAGRTPGLIPEEPLPYVTRFHNTYEAAKAEAEKLFLSALENGVPLTIHRPSMVVGDSRTGKIVRFQVFYYLCEFLSGRPTRGFIPNLAGATLDTVPVDYVARAIQWTSCHTQTIGQIFHLCSGPGQMIVLTVLIEEVRAFLRDIGIPLPHLYIISKKLFRSAISIASLVTTHRLRQTLHRLPLFLDYLDESQSFANMKTEKSFISAGITVPPSHIYLEELFRYYHKTKKRFTKS